MASGFGFRRRAGAGGGGGGVGAAEEPAGWGRVAGCGCHWRCSFLSVAVGDWLAVDWRLAIWWLAIWWLMVGWASGGGGWIQAVGATARAILLARFRVLVFHAPAHCWTGIERWERPRRGLTHPRGIERSACRIRRWLQYRRFWPCCPEPGFLMVARFSPDAFAFGLETPSGGLRSPCTWAARVGFRGDVTPLGPGCRTCWCQCTAFMYAWQGSCVTEFSRRQAVFCTGAGDGKGNSAAGVFAGGAAGAGAVPAAGRCLFVGSRGCCGWGWSTVRLGRIPSRDGSACLLPAGTRGGRLQGVLT